LPPKTIVLVARGTQHNPKPMRLFTLIGTVGDSVNQPLELA
jgi:hypothetical protein